MPSTKTKIAVYIDPDLDQWLSSLPPNQRSQVINEAIRRTYLSNDPQGITNESTPVDPSAPRVHPSSTESTSALLSRLDELETKVGYAEWNIQELTDDFQELPGLEAFAELNASDLTNAAKAINRVGADALENAILSYPNLNQRLLVVEDRLKRQAEKLESLKPLLELVYSGGMERLEKLMNAAPALLEIVRELEMSQ